MPKGQFYYHERCLPALSIRLSDGLKYGLCVVCGEDGEVCKAEIGNHIIRKVEDYRSVEEGTSFVNLTPVRIPVPEAEPFEEPPAAPEMAPEGTGEELPEIIAEAVEAGVVEIVEPEPEPELSEREKQIKALKDQLRELENE